MVTAWVSVLFPHLKEKRESPFPPTPKTDKVNFSRPALEMARNRAFIFLMKRGKRKLKVGYVHWIGRKAVGMGGGGQAWRQGRSCRKCYALDLFLHGEEAEGPRLPLCCSSFLPYGSRVEESKDKVL